MAIITLSAIFAKIRRLTGSSDPFQMPDYANPNDPNSVGLADYVNSFYLYDFPAQYRSLKLKDIYTFDTIQNVDTYAFDSEHFTTVQSPAFCAKREILLSYDRYSFYGLNYNWQYQDFFAIGNGTAGVPTAYSGMTTATPILRSVNNNSNTSQNPNYPASRVQNILITVNTATSTLNVTDDGEGNLIGDCISGLINYFTGQISDLVFTQAVPQGNQIQIQYNPFRPSIPLSILFFQNQFTLRPVPDRGYTIEIVAYRQPTQALASIPANQGTPELSEWWECIAIGAAKKIYEDRLDSDGIALMDKMLGERYNTIFTRTWAELGKQRCHTIFADQLRNNGSGPGFFGSI